MKRYCKKKRHFCLESISPNRRRSEQRAAEEKNARAGKKKKSSVDVDVDVDVGHRSAPFVCSLITNTDVEDDAGNP